MPRRKTKTHPDYGAPFATRLRELIEDAKIPQSALAEHIGVTRQAVSAYSLGTSLPDIEKFEGIADYFAVSTEYLLGRSDIKKADASKEATAEYLGLSEGAIDAIRHLQFGRMVYAPLRDYKPEIVMEPLNEIFSLWLELVNLTDLTGGMYKLVMATKDFNTSGLRPERYKLSDSQKDSILQLQEGDYVVLSLQEQLGYYAQTVQTEFQKSIDMLTIEAERMAKRLQEEYGE